MRYIFTALLALAMGSAVAQSSGNLGGITTLIDTIRVGSEQYGNSTQTRRWSVIFDVNPYPTECANRYLLDETIDAQVTLLARAKSVGGTVRVGLRDLEPGNFSECAVQWVED